MRAPRAPATTSARAPRETRAKGAPDSRSSTSERPERLERDVVEPRSERLARGADVKTVMSSLRGSREQSGLPQLVDHLPQPRRRGDRNWFYLHPGPSRRQEGE